MKFSLDKAVKAKSTGEKKEKRAPLEETPPRPSKFVKISDISIEEGPKPERPSGKKLQPDSPLVMCIYKATDNAGDMWEAYQGSEPKKLWQIQLASFGRPARQPRVALGQVFRRCTRRQMHTLPRLPLGRLR